jgi:hypothetical protein
MNLHVVEYADLLDIMTKATILAATPMPSGGAIYVAEYAGNDVVIVTDGLSGAATVIEADDANYGGSIHEHARHAHDIGTL